MYEIKNFSEETTDGKSAKEAVIFVKVRLTSQIERIENFEMFILNFGKPSKVKAVNWYCTNHTLHFF